MSKGAKGARLQRIFDYLYSHPSVMVNDIAAALQMEYVTVNSGMMAVALAGLFRYDTRLNDSNFERTEV